MGYLNYNMFMISIITPVLNEKSFIRPYLKHINHINGNFELIIVDGGSSDGTLQEIKENQKIFKHKLRILETYQGRGNQMNKGASIAEGDILLFLHIDSTLERDALDKIENEMKNHNIIGGGLIQAFIEPDDFLKFLSNFGNFRARRNKIFFGDYAYCKTWHRYG